MGSLGLTSETTPTSVVIIAGAYGETRKMTLLTFSSWTHGVCQHAPAGFDRRGHEWLVEGFVNGLTGMGP